MATQPISPGVTSTGSTTTTTPAFRSDAGPGTVAGSSVGRNRATRGGVADLAAAVDIFTSQVLQGGAPDLTSVLDARIPGTFTEGNYDRTTDTRKARPGGSRTVRTLLSEMRSWDDETIRQTQQRLFAAGYYGPSYYGDGEAVVQWGFVDQDTQQAYSLLLADAVAHRRPLDALLLDRSKTFAETGQLANGGNVGPDAARRVGGGNLYQTTVTGGDTIRTTADRVAAAVLGRAATEAEKAKYVPFIQQLERAEDSRVNNANEAQSQAVFNAGTDPASGATAMPVNGGRISHNFGQDRGDHKHGGVDIAAPGGSPVYSAVGGTVLKVQGKGDGNAAGNRVWIQGADGNTYGYFHLNDNGFNAVKVGDQVNAGAQIGQVGSTGRSTGNHLHFEIRKGGVSGTNLDPSPFLSTAGAASGNPGVAGAASSASGSVVDQVMAAIAAPESGGNYNARNGRTGAYGKYQIMPSNWPEWARAAGIGKNAPQTAENQETVVRDRITRYLSTYGSAEAVAVAWYAGPAAAFRYKQNPNAAEFQRKQGRGNEPSIAEYVGMVTKGMSVAPPDTNADTYLPAATVERQTVNVQDQLEEGLRRDNPAEAGAWDVANQYESFRQILNRSSGGA